MACIGIGGVFTVAGFINEFGKDGMALSMIGLMLVTIGLTIPFSSILMQAL